MAVADARDVILLAGKGHEPYQEIAGVRHPFSDLDDRKVGAGGAAMSAIRRAAPRMAPPFAWSDKVANAESPLPMGRGLGGGSMMRLSEAGAMLGVMHQGPDAEFGEVGTDSRSVTPGMLFVALKGDRFDGHDFVREVLAQRCRRRHGRARLGRRQSGPAADSRKRYPSRAGRNSPVPGAVASRFR